MNIEIANKLLQLRKEKGLSQEQLAAELGISRQAISKWERAEASPDTDNLIELAKLYGVSLDDLLLHEPDSKETNKVDETEETIEDKIKGKFKDKFKDTKNEYVHVGLDGIHVKEKDGDEVHVTWHGIHVEEKGGDNVHIGDDGIFVNGDKYEKEDWYDLHHYQNSHYFPFGMLIGFGVLIYSIITSNWHPTWIILLSIPLFTSLVSAIKKRKFSCFAYPVFTLMVYLGYGFFKDMWHPSWVIFLTIPCYYSIAHYFDHRKKDFD